MKKNGLLGLILSFAIGFSSIFNIYALPGDNNDGKVVNEKNVAPQFSYSVKVKRPVDIIVLTDYTGQKYADLQSSITNMKTQLIPKGADIKETYVNDMVKVGTIRDYLRNYYRYAYFNYSWAEYSWWSPNNAGNDTNRQETASFLVEKTTSLETQAHKLPYRNPWVVSNVLTNTYTTTTRTGFHDWIEYTLTLANDVITSGIFKFDQNWEGAGNGCYADGFQYGSVKVDKAFQTGEIVNTVDTDLNILNVDNIKNIALRNNSERYLLICTDSLQDMGNLTTDLKNYITANNIKIKASVNELTKDYLLTQENYITEVFNTSKEVYYHTRTKRWLRTGADSGSEYAVDITEQIQPVGYTVYDIKEQNGYILYFSKNIEGSRKFAYKNSENIFANCSIANVTDCYVGYDYYSSANYFLLYTSDKKIYYYNPGNGAYSLQINNADRLFTDTFDSRQKAYRGIDNTLMASVTEIRGDSSKKEIYYKDAAGNRKLRLWYYYRSSSYYADIPLNNVKNAQYFFNYDVYWIYYNFAFVLTEDNKLYEYCLTNNTLYPLMIGVNTLYSIEGYNYTNHSFNSGVTPVPKDVPPITYKKMYKMWHSTFYELDNGTVLYKRIDHITAERRNDDGEKYWVYHAVESNLLTAPFNGIRKFESYYYDYYGTGSYKVNQVILIDNSNNVYGIQDSWNGDSTYFTFGIQKMSNNSNVKDFALIRNITAAYGVPTIYYLLINGTVMKNNPDVAYYTFTTNVSEISSWSNMAGNLYSGETGTLILLKPDGTVQGIGQSSHWQLGQNSSEVTSLVNPLKSRVTLLNTTKPYYRLNDLMDTNKQNMYYKQGDYQTAVSDITKELTFTSTVTNNKVVVGEPIEVTGVYSDYENDAEYARKWKFAHNPYYFENSMGTDPNNGKEISVPLTALNYSGRYTITGQARDNPYNNNAFDNYRLWSRNTDTLIVDANRRPYAKARVTIVPNGYYYKVNAYDAGSYDLDHYSQTNHGIVQYDWRWRTESEGIWHNERISKSNCSADDTYVIQLRVLDMDGYWSDYHTIQIDEDNPPVALFDIDKKVINISEKLKVKDQSFPQSFSTITNWHWIVKKLNSDGSEPTANLQNKTYTTSNNGTGLMAGYDVNVKTDYSSNGAGKYRVYLRVKDSNGLWSDGGTDAAPNLINFYSKNFEVDRPPAASFTIEKNPIKVDETLKLKDTSAATGTSSLAKWHWIVKKLNPDGSVPGSDIQNEKFGDSNTGIGELSGYDVNVKTQYADTGPGTYRIYLRVMNGNGMWSDGGTDIIANLDSCFTRDIVVEESLKMSNFRVVRVRDLHLDSYYYNSATGQYDDRPMNVNLMAIDYQNFGGLVDGLTKGYLFEFEIDTVNFNDSTDTIVIVPHFYTCDAYSRDEQERDLYWENSRHEILKAGTGGHSSWAVITLDTNDRITTGEKTATWRGFYLIPGTAWAVPAGTSSPNAKGNRINRDIIVNFEIKGYKDGVMKYDYNLKQWPLERTAEKWPYKIGDVIRYSHTKSNLDDNNVIINRP